MTVDAFLASATKKLRGAGIESARLDCLILLEDATQKDRASLLAHPETVLSDQRLDLLTSQVARRAHQEPLAYIRGKTEFYGRDFFVNSRILVPRPESESFINLLKDDKLNTKSTRILDLGTGGGCLGVTLSLEFPSSIVVLADIDKKALEVAQKNADMLGAKVGYIKSDLLHDVHGKYDIIVTNLPYVPDNYPVNKPTAFEPSLALYAGKDGMDLYRNFWDQIHQQTAKPALILTEALMNQHEAQVELADMSGYKLDATEGLVQLFVSATHAEG